MTNSKFTENIKNKIKNILKNNNGFSILNLEGSYLRKDDDGNLYYNTTEIITFKNKDGKEIKIIPSYEKLYSAKMTLSLETYRAFGNFNQLKDEIIEKDSNKPIDFSTYKKVGQELYSKLFINLKFEKKAIRFDKEGNKEITSKKDIRNNVYTDGVIVDGIKYVFFKRGGSKARTAQAIFVKEKYKELLLKPCLLGLKFKHNENKLKHDKIYCAETNNIETTEKWILAENGECNINVDENKSYTIYLKNENGKLITGLIGNIHGNWLSVKFLWVI